MERVELEVSQRDTTRKNVRFLRRKGVTPANLYGHGIDSLRLQGDTKNLEQMLTRVTKTDLINLKVSGSDTPRMVFIREIQRNPTNDHLLHVDFYQVKMTEKIKADIPIKLVGEAPVLRKKNITLLHFIDFIHVEALPNDLPHNIEVDLSTLAEVEQAIYIKDIQLAKDITLLTDPEQVIIKAVEARREVEEVPVAAVVAAEGEEAVVAEGEAAAPPAKGQPYPAKGKTSKE